MDGNLGSSGRCDDISNCADSKLVAFSLGFAEEISFHSNFLFTFVVLS